MTSTIDISPLFCTCRELILGHLPPAPTSVLPRRFRSESVVDDRVAPALARTPSPAGREHGGYDELTISWATLVQASRLVEALEKQV